MGVKSTVDLTREQAIDKAVDLHGRANRRIISAQYHVLSDEELEDELMRMNDAANDGEGFENYSIRY